MAQIHFVFDELAYAHLRYSVEMLQFTPKNKLSEEGQKFLDMIVKGIYNNEDIELKIDSETFKNRVEFTAIFANALLHFLQDQDNSANLQECVKIGDKGD